MANYVHIVPHFHWDREWYFTAEESMILLIRDMDEIMNILEQEEDYPCFVLDGQTVVLEDYFSVKPENRQRVANLIKQQKLIIGPWYTQTDEMVVGGESIVRNLLYGKLDCEEFGEIMQIGYLPDSFGQSARMPQILNGFGIDRCMFWRGMSERMGTDRTEFYWSDGEFKTIVQLLPLGYAIGKYLPTEAAALQTRLDKYFQVLEQCAATDYILLPNGHDQMPIQKNIKEVMAQIESIYPEKKVSLNRFEDMFEEIEKAENLATVTGELLDGRYMRVHRSIFSTRADIKSANTRIENKITNLLEPLMSIAYRLGFPYEHGLMEGIWKEILKNHAHDSIGCCCSDKVHKIIADRFFIAEERTDRLIDFYKRGIVDAMPCDQTLDKLTLFNLLPYDRSSVVIAEIITKMKGFQLRDQNGCELKYKLIDSEEVDAGIIDRQIVHYGNYDPFVKYIIAIEDELPSFGYKTYLISESAPIQKTDLACDKLENEFVCITFEANGTINVLDKNTNVTYEQVLLIEDGGDDGDEYDYSPLADDFIVTNKEVTATVRICDYELFSEAHISYTLLIPKNLESRKKKICDGTLSVDMCITLKKHSPVSELNITVDNQGCDHRVRVLFPNKLSTLFSVSDNQFGSIERAVVDGAMEVWEAEKWSERPDAIYPFLSYVHCKTPTGIGVITNSVREFEITGDDFDTIAITLFRSVGNLGKENLIRRPGRPSGIKLDTPDSQMLGTGNYQLAFTTEVNQIALLAKDYLTPIIFYNKMPFNAMKLNCWDFTTPYEFSLFQISRNGIIMSTVKKAEKSEELLIRLYNPSNDVLSDSVTIPLLKEVNLDESLANECNLSEVTLCSNEVKTYSAG